MRWDELFCSSSANVSVKELLKYFYIFQCFFCKDKRCTFLNYSTVHTLHTCIHVCIYAWLHVIHAIHRVLLCVWQLTFTFTSYYTNNWNKIVQATFNVTIPFRATFTFTYIHCATNLCYMYKRDVFVQKSTTVLVTNVRMVDNVSA